MKKVFKPDYFGWCFLVILELLFILFLCWVFKKGVNFESSILFDLTGYTLAFVSSLAILSQLYDVYLLVVFIRYEVGRTIEIDNENKFIVIKKMNQVQSFSFNDLKYIVYSKGRFNSRSLTSHLSYTQLDFSENRRLLITSFSINCDDLADLINSYSTRNLNRSRGLFETIRFF